MTITTSNLYEQAPPYSFLQININDSSGAVTAVSNSTAGKVVKVWRYNLYVNGGADLTFNSQGIGSATPLFGPVSYGGAVVQALFNDMPGGKDWVPWFQTLSGESLKIALGSAVRLTGTILYTIESSP